MLLIKGLSALGIFANLIVIFFASQLISQIEASPSYAQSLRDPNLLLEQFQTAAIRLLDEQAPFTNRTIRKNPAPWFDVSLRRLCKERDTLYNKAKHLNSPLCVSISFCVSS